MFERFTERARKVVVLAQEEACSLKHDHIGTEHILLGLLREEEGLAARVLESLDITVERVREQVVAIAGSGAEVTSGQIPFSERAKKVLEMGLREALTLGHNYIGSEHILLGLVRENEGAAARILLDFGADSQKVRNEVIRMLSGPGGRGSFEKIVAPRELTEEAGWLLETVAKEIEDQLGRKPDAGDLLVALACIPEGIAARVLAELEIGADALQRAGDAVRREDAPPGVKDLRAEIDRVRKEKEAKIEAQQLDDAAKLRDAERRLAEQADQRLQDALGEVRRLLGLAGP